MRQRLSAAAHKALPHANPLSVAQMNTLVAFAEKTKPQTSLEIGCGAGSFSIALAKAMPHNAIAIDINPYMLDRARADAVKAGVAGSVKFLQRPAADYVCGPVDLAICIGASGAYGTPRDCLSALASLVDIGGHIVFGELVWMARPSKDYLDLLGVSEATYWNVDETSSVLSAFGMSMVHEVVASPKAWAAYEASVFKGRLEFAETLSAQRATEVVKEANTWYSQFQGEGRDVLGFSAVVAKRSAR